MEVAAKNRNIDGTIKAVDELIAQGFSASSILSEIPRRVVNSDDRPTSDIQKAHILRKIAEVDYRLSDRTDEQLVLLDTSCFVAQTVIAPPTVVLSRSIFLLSCVCVCICILRVSLLIVWMDMYVYLCAIENDKNTAVSFTPKKQTPGSCCIPCCLSTFHHAFRTMTIDTYRQCFSSSFSSTTHTGSKSNRRRMGTNRNHVPSKGTPDIGLSNISHERDRGRERRRYGSAHRPLRKLQ